MYNKLGQACVTNLDSFVYYKLGQRLMHIGAAITNQGNRYYKIGQLLQIGAKYIINCGRYYKLGQLLQIGA